MLRGFHHALGTEPDADMHGESHLLRQRKSVTASRPRSRHGDWNRPCAGGFIDVDPRTIAVGLGPREVGTGSSDREWLSPGHTAAVHGTTRALAEGANSRSRPPG